MHSVTVHIVHTHDRHLAAEIQLYHSMLCSAAVMFKMVTLQGYQLELLGKIGYWLLILKQTVDISFFLNHCKTVCLVPMSFLVIIVVVSLFHGSVLSQEIQGF